MKTKRKTKVKQNKQTKKQNKNKNKNKTKQNKTKTKTKQKQKQKNPQKHCLLATVILPFIGKITITSWPPWVHLKLFFSLCNIRHAK